MSNTPTVLAFTTMAPVYGLSGVNCYAAGQMGVYNHDIGGMTYSTVQSTYNHQILSLGLEAELQGFGSYGLTSSGQTYGSLMSEYNLGVPDLRARCYRAR